jgi:aspartate carbamoyltransferase catalytic subunit
MGEDIKEHLASRGIEYEETEDISRIEQSDVVYQTRVQRERFEDPESSPYFPGTVVRLRDEEPPDLEAALRGLALPPAAA